MTSSNTCLPSKTAANTFMHSQTPPAPDLQDRILVGHINKLGRMRKIKLQSKPGIFFKKSVYRAKISK